MVVEYIQEWSSVQKPPGYQVTEAHSVPCFVFISYKLVGTFLFGLSVNESVTFISKYAVGRLRPHFLDVCRPNITASICDSHVPRVSAYVNNFTCTMPDDEKMLDSRYVMTHRNRIIITNKKLSYCWETVRRESMPRIAEMDVEMTT